MIEKMDKTLIEKLKEVIQQHQDLTGERVVSCCFYWTNNFGEGDCRITKIDVNIDAVERIRRVESANKIRSYLLKLWKK